MKRILVLLTAVFLAVTLMGCGDSETAGGKAGDPDSLILGENAFGVKAYVRNMTSEIVTFIVVPYGLDFGMEGGKGEVDGPGGLFGAPGLVPGKKKGDQVELNGSFMIYAGDKNGPSVEITVNGTFGIDALKSDFSTMYYFLYEDGQFIKSDKESVYK